MLGDDRIEQLVTAWKTSCLQEVELEGDAIRTFGYLPMVTRPSDLKFGWPPSSQEEREKYAAMAKTMISAAAAELARDLKGKEPLAQLKILVNSPHFQGIKNSAGQEFGDVQKELQAIEFRVRKLAEDFSSKPEPQTLRELEAITRDFMPIGVSQQLEAARNSVTVVCFGEYALHRKTLMEIIQPPHGTKSQNWIGLPHFMYAHTFPKGTVFLDVAEFKGKLGFPVIGINSESERSIVVTEERETVEQKGVMLSTFSPELHEATLSPFGVLFMESARAEDENVKLIGEADYATNVYDIGLVLKHKTPKSDVLEESQFGVLERRGCSSKFAPQLRMSKLQYLSLVSLLEEKGWSLAEAVSKFGYQLGAAHEQGVYPLLPYIGNVDIHGNLLDLGEATPNNRNLEMWLKERQMPAELNENAVQLCQLRGLDIALGKPNNGFSLFSWQQGFGLETLVESLKEDASGGIEDQRGYGGRFPDNPLLKQFLTGYFAARAGRQSGEKYASELLGNLLNRNDVDGYWTGIDSEEVIKKVYGHVVVSNNKMTSLPGRAADCHLPIEFIMGL